MDNYGRINLSGRMVKQQQDSSKHSGRAVISVILGIVSIFLAFCGCSSFLGLFLGIIAFVEALCGKSIAGKILSIIGIVLSAVGIFVFLFFYDGLSDPMF